MLSNVRNDIRYALRTLGRNPGFALAAIVPIALGIGINTGVFSILNSVAWRPLPVPEPDALVSVYQDFRGGPRRTVSRRAQPVLDSRNTAPIATRRTRSRG